MNRVLEEIDLYLTLACNLRCGFCSVRANEHPPAVLSLARIRDLVDEAVDLGLTDLHLTGGEPTLRPDLEAVVAHAAGKGVRTRIITNGTLLGRERLLRLQDAGLGSLMVSLDGMEATHDALRGVPGTFRKASDAVRDAADLGLPTRVSAVAFLDNLPEVPALVRHAADLGASVFSVFLGSPLGRARAFRDRVVPPDRWRAFLEDFQARTWSGAFGHRIDLVAEQAFLWADDPAFSAFDRRDLRGRGAGCAALPGVFDYLIVRPDGAVFQCVFLLHDAPPVGNVAEGLGVLLARLARERPAEALSRPGPPCEDRACFDLCQGGCRGYAFLGGGTWTGADPRCAWEPTGQRPRYVPLCPIAKLNVRTGQIRGSSEMALQPG